jgi:hypothetical protein
MSERISHAAPARGGPLRIASATIAWFDRPEGRTLRLLLFGFVVALLGTFELSRVHPAPWTLLQTRIDGLQSALSTLDRGGAILTTSTPGSSAIYPAGSGDDQGLYLIVPWVSHVLGISDPVNVLRWMALIGFGIAVAMYPWLIRELSGSTIAGLLSPFLLLIGLWLMPLGDIYWTSAWAILALLPGVLLLDRRWPRHGLAILCGLLVLASLASAIRAQAGLPVLVAAVLVVIRLPWSRSRRAGAIVLCLVAYVSISNLGMAAARAERDHQLGERTLVTTGGNGHPFWHTAYIGLGYLRNDWDIRYYDGVAYRDVLREDPKARFLGPAYGGILRDRYFHLIGSDPVFAVKDYGAKVIVSLRPVVVALIALALIGPLLLLSGASRRRWRRDALFVLIAALIALTAPLLAIPEGGYLLGWLGAVLLAGILAGSALLGELQRPADGETPRWRLPIALPPVTRAIVGLSAASLILAVLLGAVAAPRIDRDALAWQNEVPAPHVVQPPDATH